jgi:2-methylcitrate dehydratase PrpD
MAITEQLAHLIAETQAKRALLDTIGVTLAGHGEAAGQIITSFVKDAGGHQEAAILGTSLYTSPAGSLGERHARACVGL